MKRDVNVLERQRAFRLNQTLCSSAKTQRNNMEERAQRNAVNPRVTGLSSGERKEEFLCTAGEQSRGREGERQMENDGGNVGVAEGI